MIDSLKGLGIKTVSTQEIFSDYEESPERYHLSNYDSHPTALANRELAEYLIESLETTREPLP